MIRIATPLLIAILGACAGATPPPKTPVAPTAAPTHPPEAGNGAPTLGPSSLSLATRDLAASRTFYETLGFVADTNFTNMPGYGQRWLILRASTMTIGLFQGMFPQNTITFHPPDVRALQRHLDTHGIKLANRAAEGTGPAFAMALDPDGNPVLFDQL